MSARPVHGDGGKKSKKMMTDRPFLHLFGITQIHDIPKPYKVEKIGRHHCFSSTTPQWQLEEGPPPAPPAAPGHPRGRIGKKRDGQDGPRPAGMGSAVHLHHVLLVVVVVVVVLCPPPMPPSLPTMTMFLARRAIIIGNITALRVVVISHGVGPMESSEASRQQSGNGGQRD